eukprot:Platyproteum_vivax@DN15086_c0_g1_i1.p1
MIEQPASFSDLALQLDTLCYEGDSFYDLRMHCIKYQTLIKTLGFMGVSFTEDLKINMFLNTFAMSDLASNISTKRPKNLEEAIQWTQDLSAHTQLMVENKEEPLLKIEQ